MEVVAVKVDNDNGIDGSFGAVDLVKCELVEFDKCVLTEERDADSYNPNDTITTVILERIPKTEMEILGKELAITASSDEDDGHYDNSDSTFDLNSERNPFADVDCDPHFSQTPQKRRQYCVPCNKLFCTINTYKKHARRIHGIKVEEARPLKCEFCRRSFAHQVSLIAHSASHTQHQDEEGNTANNVHANVNVNTSEGTLNSKPFKCLECTSSFRKIGGLTNHMKSHKNDRPFKCPISNCGKAFNKKCILENHLRVHNSVGQLRVKCPEPYCDKTFKLEQNLKDHLRVVHSERRQFKCQEPNCGKQFKLKYSLQMHMNTTHSILKPFECSHPGCDRSFKTKSSLNVHLDGHAQTRSRPKKQITDEAFKCGECDRSFCIKGQLTNHLKTHSNQVFKCSELNCGKEFSCITYLRTHIGRVHSQGRPFTCSEPNCIKSFKSKHALKMHAASRHPSRDSASLS